MVDVPKLRKYVEWVEEQDMLWNTLGHGQWLQNTWIGPMPAVGVVTLASFQGAQELQTEDCGTTYCVAGKVAHDDGFLLSPHGDLVGLLPGDVAESEEKQRWIENGWHCSNWAQHSLGLNDWQAERLFSGHNSAHQVRLIAESIAQAQGDAL